MATECAVLAGGCFWCTEAVFNQIRGVLNVESGYTGGQTQNPTYRQVCDGNTGHAEAVRIMFDNEQIAFSDLLKIFFAIHDPTQLNRQGNDIGSQYRSAIFPQNPRQEREAEHSIQLAGHNYPNKIVTTIEPVSTWYPAEDDHQDYWDGEGRKSPYCMAVIPPKLQKLKK